MSKNNLITILVSLNILLLTLFISNFLHAKSSSNISYSGVTELKGDEDFLTLKNYMTDLANKKGAAYAYEVLKKAKTKPGIDMHLMGHVVGEILYKQKGAAGMQYCTQDFRNACSHTIVVGLFNEKGIAALSEIIDACKKAPGGKGAYNMCFHGLGHGVLAFTGYDIQKTVDICSKINKNRSDGREFPECIGGAIMEIISGGDHDKALWTVQNKKYLGGEDPLYPCDNEIIPKEGKAQCYMYLTPHLFLFAGANLGNPQPQDFKKAFTYCNALADIDRANMMTCYGGFGKEFVVLAKERDIRNISSMSEDELKKVYEWCNLSDREDGRQECLKSSIGSLYWGGENDRKIAISFCSMMVSQDKTMCFDFLIKMVKYYISDKNYLENFCSEIPKQFQGNCSDLLIVND